MKKSVITISLVVLLYFAAAFPAQRIAPQVVDNALYVSYQINDLIDDKSVEALQRGIKSEVVHYIQLWQHKNFIDRQVEEFKYPVKVYWDNWEKKYHIEMDDEKRLTSNIETVKQKCTVVENFFLADLGELEKNETYRIAIKVDFQLISAESYNAISDIFSGEKKKNDSAKKSGFLSMFVNLLGLGDKEFTYKSKEFTITNAGHVAFVQ